MNVLITGANGYLARNCIRKLSGEGFYIILFTTSGNIRNEEFKDYIVYTDLNKLRHLNIDIVIHSGWGGISEDERNSEKIQLDSFEFTRDLLNNLNLKGLKTFLFFGSQSEYGKITNPVKENYPTDPKTYYGLYKKLAGDYIKYLSNIYDFEFYHLRIFSIFGGDQDRKWLIPSMTEKLKTKQLINIVHPKKKVSFLHINDFTKIINSLILNKIPSGIYNVCGTDDMTIQELVITIARILDVQKPHILYNKEVSESHIIGNNDKLMTFLKYKNFIQLEAGITKEYCS